MRVLSVDKAFCFTKDFSEDAMQRKAQILDAAGMTRAMARITHEIIERGHGAEDICLLGVRSRGVPLADRKSTRLNSSHHA